MTYRREGSSLTASISVKPFFSLLPKHLNFLYSFVRRLPPRHVYAVILSAVCAAFISQTYAAAATQKNYRVEKPGTPWSIHMRLGPSHKSKVLAYIAPKTVISAAGSCDAKWCQVSFKNMTGWVFRSYLEETDEPLTPVPATQPEGAQPQLEQAVSFRAAPKEPAVSVSVQEFPGVGMPVVGTIPGDAGGIENLARCVQQWCRVRYQQLEGWVLLAELKRDEADGFNADDKTVDETPKSEQAAPAPAITQASLTPAAVVSQARPPAQPPSAQAPPGEQIRYNVVGLGASAWLHVRDKPADTARIVNSLPPNAAGIEDMRECVRQWCLIRHGEIKGFVHRRFLARQRQQDSDRYRIDGVAVDESLKVYDFPGSDAQIVGSIPSYASGIVPIGDCSADWCHVRYLGLVGWVTTSNLAAEGSPRS